MIELLNSIGQLKQARENFGKMLAQKEFNAEFKKENLIKALYAISANANARAKLVLILDKESLMPLQLIKVLGELNETQRANFVLMLSDAIFNANIEIFIQAMNNLRIDEARLLPAFVSQFDAAVKVQGEPALQAFDQRAVVSQNRLLAIIDPVETAATVAVQVIYEQLHNNQDEEKLIIAKAGAAVVASIDGKDATQAAADVTASPGMFQGKSILVKEELYNMLGSVFGAGLNAKNKLQNLLNEIKDNSTASVNFLSFSNWGHGKNEHPLSTLIKEPGFNSQVFAELLKNPRFAQAEKSFQRILSRSTQGDFVKVVGLINSLNTDTKRTNFLVLLTRNNNTIKLSGILNMQVQGDKLQALIVPEFINTFETLTDKLNTPDNKARLKDLINTLDDTGRANLIKIANLLGNNIGHLVTFIQTNQFSGTNFAYLLNSSQEIKANEQPIEGTVFQQNIINIITSLAPVLKAAERANIILAMNAILDAKNAQGAGLADDVKVRARASFAAILSNPTLMPGKLTTVLNALDTPAKKVNFTEMLGAQTFDAAQATALITAINNLRVDQARVLPGFVVVFDNPVADPVAVFNNGGAIYGVITPITTAATVAVTQLETELKTIGAQADLMATKVVTAALSLTAVINAVKLT